LTNAPRLGRRATIALSAIFSYTVFAGFLAQVFGGLPAVIVPLPVPVAATVFLVFGASLLAGARVYTFRPGRLASFARFGLGLPLLAAAAVFFTVASSDYGFYLLFVTYPLFAWIGLIGVPAWLIAISRDPAKR
jgi:hypothetical protein